MNPSSTKPYLLRAIHEWCSDNGFTPYLSVRVDERASVPREYVRDGEIVLNVSVDATNRLVLGNERVEFQARFGGVARDISIPVDAVQAIYARENGHGMAFEVSKEPADDEAVAEEGPVEADAPPRQRPTLSAVPAPSAPEQGEATHGRPDDGGRDGSEAFASAEGTPASGGDATAAPAPSAPAPPPPRDTPPDDEPGSATGGSRRRGRPRLTRVK